MSLYFVGNEYDMDLAIVECVKLMRLQDSKVKVGFNNMKMVKIFMKNLSHEVSEQNLDPQGMNFHVDVLVEEEAHDADDE